MEEDIKYNSEELNQAYLNSNIHRLYSKDKPLSPRDPLIMAFLPWKKLGKLGALFGIKKLSDDAYDKYQKRLQEKEVSEYKNKKRLLPKGQTGWLTAAIAENPAVMTAAGYKVEPSGEVIYQEPNKKLAHNLSTIGEAAITAQTMAADATALFSAIRHPIQTGKQIVKAVKDLSWFVRHPGAIKVYHGTNFPTFQNLKQANNASNVNVGLHVSPFENTANSFARSKSGHVLEGYIPNEPLIETIDLGRNDYRWISDNVQFAARPSYGINADGLPTSGYYDISPYSQLQFKLLKRYGAQPKITRGNPIFDFKNNKPSFQYALNTEKEVSIPLRSETMPQIKDSKELQDILSMPENSRELSLQKNTAAANFLSKNNIKSLKYHNNNPSEGYGISYAITDPSIIYIPKIKSWRDANLLKYPILYEFNK